MITLYCMSRGVQARFTQVEFVWVNCYLPSSARGRRFDQGSEPGHHPTNHQSQSQRLKRDWSLGDIGEVFGNIVSTCILGKSGVESCREIWWPQPALGRPKGRRLLWLKWCCNNSNVVLNTWGDIKLLLLIFWKTLNINFCDQNSERLLTNLDLIYTLAPSSSIFKEYWLKNKPTWSIQFKLGLMKSFKGSSVSLNRTWKVQLFFGLSGISLYICMWLFYWWKLIPLLVNMVRRSLMKFPRGHIWYWNYIWLQNIIHPYSSKFTSSSSTDNFHISADDTLPLLLLWPIQQKQKKQNTKNRTQKR